MKQFFYIPKTNTLGETVFKLDTLFNLNNKILIWGNGLSLSNTLDFISPYRLDRHGLCAIQVRLNINSYHDKMHIYHLAQSNRIYVLSDPRYIKVLDDELEFIKSLILD